MTKPERELPRSGFSVPPPRPGVASIAVDFHNEIAIHEYDGEGACRMTSAGVRHDVVDRRFTAVYVVLFRQNIRQRLKKKNGPYFRDFICAVSPDGIFPDGE
ncbi:MAG: hypothetical protein LBJ23_01870 [Tannerella sp.]|jgi:hypothetical protein|nr:hypothetical protein [Tannerella sp.]